VPPGEVLWAGCGLQVRGLDVCPARGLVAVADDTTLDVLDLTTRRVVQALDPPVPGPAALRFDPDPASDRLFRGYPGGLDWVAVPGGRVAEPVPVVRPGRVGRIAFARGGLVFADEARVTRCGAADLRPTTTTNLTGEAPTGVDIRALAARPDGGELLAAYGDRVEFLDPDTLRPVRAELRTGKAEVLDAVYTPDGAKVFLGRRDGVAELRDAESGRPVARPMPHPRAVAAVAVSADGKLLLTGCRDGTARFWDAATGLPLGAPLRHPGAVTHVAFAPGDTHAVTGTSAGHVVTWAVPPPG
jgi:WD40 repeat protein